MQEQVKYKLEVDGEIFHMEYDSVDSALDGAHLLFEANPQYEEARVVKFVKQPLDIFIRNKNHKS